MEFKFSNTTCQCLRKAACQVQNQEQTQEVRLPEGMPDIGRVLGCWGQTLIRSKEWRTGGMTVSGGVMAWALYAPEDGSEPRSVETWIPFQLKWDFPETQRDGFICVTPMLKALDARGTSARKLMVRACVSLLGEALEPVEPEIYSAQNPPEDVQLLLSSYPMELPREAGEKLFQVDEELTLPGTYPGMEKILRYEVTPQIADQKVMAGRLVFRGQCAVHILYAAADGSIHGWDTEVPFSQYTDLDRDYGPNATAWVIPMLTGLELIREEQHLQLKCGVAAQYVIYDRATVEIVEDAYSPQRSVKPETQELKLPARLDQRQDPLRISQTLDLQGGKIMDVCFYPDQPVRRQEGDTAEVTLAGHFQILYRDDAGTIQGISARCEKSCTFASDPGNRVDAYVRPTGQPQASVTPQGVELTAECLLESTVFAEQGLPMVTCLELGEMKEPDPARPSLILRRAGDGRLWDIARECGSTVDAIRAANDLEEEPERGRLLLIPVL